MSNGKVFIRRRLVWLAWYPLRGRRCSWDFERRTWVDFDPDAGPWHLSIGFGPLYLGLGPGVPTP